ncbi:MAG TPA: tRNA-uridine aminocarboxypropyltransferase [Candidatus Dormibacteraeota bacterium]|nr:tRNA-uridine aminocarboxypropyltransferase [Candidatus Dormibacteraeota bacterium]
MATVGAESFSRAPADRRSAGAAEARASCYRCFKPRVACICSAIRRVDNRTRITILQHPRERFHALGTVRIARLGLAHAQVEWCAPWEDAGAIRDRLPAGAALLYPAPGARDLAQLPAVEHPRHLVVIDGTWFLAKKIYDAHAWLRDLPHVSLTPSRPGGYRIRREPQAHCLATLEAIVDALRILEPQTAGLDGLLEAFAIMIDRQAAYLPA